MNICVVFLIQIFSRKEPRHLRIKLIKGTNGNHANKATEVVDLTKICSIYIRHIVKSFESK